MIVVESRESIDTREGRVQGINAFQKRLQGVPLEQLQLQRYSSVNFSSRWSIVAQVVPRLMRNPQVHVNIHLVSHAGAIAPQFLQFSSDF